MKKLILFSTTLMFVACQTTDTIAKLSGYDTQSLAKGQKSFSLDNPFPEKGYELKGCLYRNVEIHKFSDNDTLYYIKYNPGREERNFYFTVIDKQTTDTILDNALNKNKIRSVYKREEWLDGALKELGIQDYRQTKGRWTYYAPKSKMVKGNLSTDRVRTGYHREYEQLTYESACKTYYTQRNPRPKYTGMEILGALYIINNFFPNDNTKREGKTQWDLLNDAQKAIIHEHDNAK